MDLLLLTNSFPHDRITEFLDIEIGYLCSQFDRVRVCPQRPKGPLVRDLPGNAVVDYSLAASMCPPGSILGGRARAAVGLGSLVRSWGLGSGRSRRWSEDDVLKLSWWRAMTQYRADVVTIRRWAEAAAPPSLAYTFWLSCATAGLKLAWPDVPLVTRAHGGDIYSEVFGWRDYPFQGMELASVDRVYCVSDQGRTYLARKYPQVKPRLRAGRLGIKDLGRPAVLGRGGRTSLRVLSASSIDQNKRVELIARAVGALAAMGLDVEWVHYGEGPSRRSVEEVVDSFPASARGVLAGQVAQEVVRQEFQSGRWDVFVNLSQSEGVPVSLMEAQCVGLPVVATSVGGTPEVVDSRWNELASVEEGPAEIAVRIRRAADSDVQFVQLRRANWSKLFDADKNYADFAQELRTLAR